MRGLKTEVTSLHYYVTSVPYFLEHGVFQKVYSETVVDGPLVGRSTTVFYVPFLGFRPFWKKA